MVIASIVICSLGGLTYNILDRGDLKPIFHQKANPLAFYVTDTNI